MATEYAVICWSRCCKPPPKLRLNKKTPPYKWEKLLRTDRNRDGLLL